jgi:hypothetical protein
MSRLVKVAMVAVMALAGALSLRAWAGEKHNMSKMPAQKMPAEFEKLKSLVGTWTGKAKMHGEKEENMVVTYELTAAGSAIVEKFNPGTPGEMVSVYNVEGGKVRMKHYCSMGNAPVMTLKKATDKSLNFEMKGVNGISSAKELHMHGLTITWTDKDHIAAEWVSYNKGKAEPCHAFNFTRK